MRKGVEVEFLMKEKVRGGMKKGEGEGVEVGNRVRVVEGEVERVGVGGERGGGNVEESGNMGEMDGVEKEVEELGGKVKVVEEEWEWVEVRGGEMGNGEGELKGVEKRMEEMGGEMGCLGMGGEMLFVGIWKKVGIFREEVGGGGKE